jgi:hypothetical protein
MHAALSLPLSLLVGPSQEEIGAGNLGTCLTQNYGWASTCGAHAAPPANLEPGDVVVVRVDAALRGKPNIERFWEISIFVGERSAACAFRPTAPGRWDELSASSSFLKK